MKLKLIKETCYCWPGIWAVSFSIREENFKDLPQGMRSATVVMEADTVEELYTYFPKRAFE